MNEVNKLGTKIIARTLELLAESEFSIERISTTVDLTHDRTSISVSIIVDGRKFSALHYMREGHVDEKEFINIYAQAIVRELENRSTLHEDRVSSEPRNQDVNGSNRDSSTAIARTPDMDRNDNEHEFRAQR